MNNINVQTPDNNSFNLLALCKRSPNQTSNQPTYPSQENKSDVFEKKDANKPEDKKGKHTLIKDLLISAALIAGGLAAIKIFAKSRRGASSNFYRRNPKIEELVHVTDDNAFIHGSRKIKKLTADKNVSIFGEHSEITELYAGKNVSLNHTSNVGKIKAGNKVHVWDNSSVGKIDAEGDVNLSDNAKAEEIKSNAQVWLMNSTVAKKIEAEGDIHIYDNAQAGEIKSNAQIWIANSASAKKIDAKEEALLSDEAKAEKIETQHAILYDNAKAEEIKSNGNVELFNNTFAEKIEANEIVCITNKSTAKKVVTKGKFCIDEEAQAGDVWSSGAEVKNEAKVKNLYTQDKPVYVNDNAFVSFISARDTSVSVSEHSVIKNIEVTSSHPESVTLSDNCSVETIVFKDKKGVVTLKDFSGKRPKVINGIINEVHSKRSYGYDYWGDYGKDYNGYRRSSNNGSSNNINKSDNPTRKSDALLLGFKTLYPSEEQVKTRRRELAKKYHPDRCVGLDEKTKKEYEEKLKDYNSALDRMNKGDYRM